MNLHQLKLFFYVAQFRSFTMAAEFLHISQPSISKQVRALEDTFNQKLYTYENRKLELTDLGREIYETSKIIFETEKLVEKKLKGTKEIDLLIIEGNSLATSLILPKVLFDFKTLFPNQSIKVTTNSTKNIIKHIDNFTSHIGITGAYEKEIKRLTYEPLFKDYFAFYVNKNHPLVNQKISLSDLRNFSFIGRSAGSYSQERLNQLFIASFKHIPKIVESYDLAIDSIRGLEHSESIYFGSSILTNYYAKQTDIIPLELSIPKELRHFFEHQFYLIYSNFFSDQPEIFSLINLIKNKNI